MPMVRSAGHVGSLANGWTSQGHDGSRPRRPYPSRPWGLRPQTPLSA